MRRWLGLALAVALMIPALAVMGGEPYEYYKDEFNSVSFSGSNGSLHWKSPWVEFGDEIAGPEAGSVRIDSEGCSGKCLHLEGKLLDVQSYGAYRSADLSMFETVELCFDIEIDGISEAVLSVYVSSDGSNWDRVRSYPALTSDGGHETVFLNDYRTKGFAVKFKVEGLLGGEVITVDNVELKGTVASTTTSSSTSTSTSTSSTSTTSAASRTTTSTTAGGSTPTTTRATTSTTDSFRATASTPSSSTTTTVATTTTSTGTGAGLPPQPPFDSGLRDTPGGLIADYEKGMMGDMGMEDVEVLGAVITADFSLAHEAFEEVKVWIAVLALFITAAIVSGMDWRRSRKNVG